MYCNCTCTFIVIYLDVGTPSSIPHQLSINLNKYYWHLFSVLVGCSSLPISLCLSCGSQKSLWHNTLYQTNISFIVKFQHIHLGISSPERSVIPAISSPENSYFLYQLATQQLFSVSARQTTVIICISSPERTAILHIYSPDRTVSLLLLFK